MSEAEGAAEGRRRRSGRGAAEARRRRERRIGHGGGSGGGGEIQTGGKGVAARVREWEETGWGREWGYRWKYEGGGPLLALVVHFSTS